MRAWTVCTAALLLIHTYKCIHVYICVYIHTWTVSGGTGEPVRKRDLTAVEPTAGAVAL
jgi:hypothetical protein